MYVRLDPYPGCKSEHLVVPSILDGDPPYTIDQMSNIGPLGGRHVMPDSPWLTNGIFALILRCWNQDGHLRPSAASCSKHLWELVDQIKRKAGASLEGGEELIPVSANVKNLSGRVSTLDDDRKKTLGFSIGTWRYAWVQATPSCKG